MSARRHCRTLRGTTQGYLGYAEGGAAYHITKSRRETRPSWNDLASAFSLFLAIINMPYNLRGRNVLIVGGARCVTFVAMWFIQLESLNRLTHKQGSWSGCGREIRRRRMQPSYQLSVQSRKGCRARQRIGGETQHHRSHYPRSMPRSML